MDYIDYYDPPKKLIKNSDFVELQKYIIDLRLIAGQSLSAKSVEGFIEGIEDTNTDVLIYLDNFVYDDTEYNTVSEYISSDFGSLEEFVLDFAKTYFVNNFREFLTRL